MDNRKQRNTFILNLAIASLIISAMMFVIEATGASRIDYKSAADGIEMMTEVYKLVIDNYVEDITTEEVARNAVDGILGNLDPYSSYLPPVNYTQLMEDTKGEFGGLGIEIQKVNDYPRIMSYPLPDTPAERLRLRAGDEIVEIDGVTTKDMDINDVVGKLRGRVGTKVSIKVKRVGRDELLPFDIERAKIPLRNVQYYGIIGDGIGYIQLVRFNKEAGHEMDVALASFNSEPNLRGVVLDLRGNPGGLLQAAQDVANKFLQRGSVIVFQQGRDPDPKKRQYLYAEQPPTLHPSVPLIILTNRGSASASEIVAGSIQDNDRGVLVGTTTFGKGSVQTVFDELPNKAGIKLTTAHYYTASGRCIHNKRNFDEDYIMSQVYGEDGGEAPVDSLAKLDKFYTLVKNRVVYGGGGVTPDIIVREKPYGNIMVQLFSQGMFYDFAAEYANKHPELSHEFVVTDAIVDDFKRFAYGNDAFEYVIPGKSTLDEFRKVLKLEKYNGDILAEVDELEQSLLDRKDKDFEASRDDIKRVLKREITVSRFGSSERALASSQWDIQLQKAIEILKDSNRYNSILAENAETGIDESQTAAAR